jgi:hypothetical protein
MPCGMPSALERFINFFRVKPPELPPEAHQLAELSPSDYQQKREIYPLIPISGWGPTEIQQMLEAHDQGNFQLSELFYHALRKEGLIASALDMRRQAVQIFPFTLQCPKDAPGEFHIFTEALAKDWQAVMPDDTRGIIIERANVFGFCVCRVTWTYKNGQRQPRLTPWTHSSLSWRQDLWCYQGMSESGVEYIRPDGREWVIFDLGEDRPWLRGLIRPLAYTLFGIITGDDRWLSFNDKFAEPIKKRVVPRLMRETKEVQQVYAKESAMRGGDMVLCPQDPAHGRGYDFDYVQVDAQGYNTLKDMLARFDERAAIIILGHNLLQSVKGGSLAAMTAAMELLSIKATADGKVLQSGFEPMSKVWARANFGTDPADYEELNGELPECKTWSLVYDFTTPAEKQAAGVRAAQFGQAFASFIKSIFGKDGVATFDKEKALELLRQLDFIEAAKRCGIPLISSEEAYAEKDEAKGQQLDALRTVRRARVSLLQAPSPPPAADQPLLLASGDTPDSAAGLIEGQQQIDQMIDASVGDGAPALAAALAALAAAADWSDLRARLEGLVRDFDLRDAQSHLREQLRTADAIGAVSVDHDLAPAARAEVDAAERRRSQAERIATMQEQQQRASLLAKAATAYALYAVARHLWDDSARAEAGGQPLEMSRGQLADALRSSWGPTGAAWDTARAEPLQHAFTGGRYQRLNTAPLRSVLSYWILDVVLDGRTTALCRSLAGYTRPAGEQGFPIPPLHWKCRTTIRGLTRAEGEARVSAPQLPELEPGFGTLEAYPAPESGPEELLRAYRGRV